MVLRQRLAPMRRRLLPAASGDWCIGGTQSGLRWAAAGGAWRVDATSGVGVGLIGNAAVPPRLRWATASEAARHLGVLSAHFSAERGLPKEDEAAERSELSHSPSATALRGARRERQATASDNSIEAKEGVAEASSGQEEVADCGQKVKADVAEELSHLEEAREELKRLKEERRAKMQGKAPGFASETARTVRRGLTTVWELLVVSLPRMLHACAAMSAAEWRVWGSTSWGHFKEEMVHYWIGFKLLCAEVLIASRLSYQALQGRELSRRERKQLVRTTNDLMRMVPFALFIVIPFMELMLPLALKLFPNMLPSTFQDKLKKEEEMRQRVQVKLEVAKFLQDCVEDKAKKLKKSRSGEAAERSRELYKLVARVREGEEISNDQFATMADLFSDEMTLDNLGRQQLVAMCSFLLLSTFGTDTFLRFTIRKRLKAIRADDRLIRAEGLKTLSYDELQSACQQRGLRWDGETKFAMRRQLTDWLDMSLDRNMPPSLLILSRALAYTSSTRFEERAAYEDVKTALSALPGVVGGVVESTSTPEESTCDATRARLEYLQAQDALIKEEAAERAREEAAERARSEAVKSLESGAAHVDGLLNEGDHEVGEVHEAQRLARENARLQEMRADTAKDAVQSAASPTEAAAAGTEGDGELQPATATVKEADMLATEEALEHEAQRERLKQMKEFAAALSVLSTSSATTDMRMELAGMVQKGADYYEEGLEDEASRSLDVLPDIELLEERYQEDDKLRQKVDLMLLSLSQELDVVDSVVGGKLRCLDTDNDGKVSLDELAHASSFLRKKLSKGKAKGLVLSLMDKDGRISTADVLGEWEKQEAAAEEEEEEDSNHGDGEEGTRKAAATK